MTSNGNGVDGDSTGDIRIGGNRVQLDGVNDKLYNYGTSSADTNTGLRGFGNAQSVFITVGTDTLDNGATNVISEVTGRFTDVQTVDITSEDIVGEPTMFVVTNCKDYIVGAVIIGENSGSNADYAYIFKGATSEARPDSDGIYYWTFDAALNGVYQELTVKTKYKSVIDTIQNIVTGPNLNRGESQKYANGYLFRLNRDADGYVINAKPFEVATSKYIFNDGNNSTTWATPTTDQNIRHMNMTSPSGEVLVIDGETLYNANESLDYGLTVIKGETKYVVAQKEYGDLKVRDSYNTLKSALAALGDYNRSTDALDFNGTISAVLDSSGRAAWVVLDSNGELYADQNEVPVVSGGKPNVKSVPYNTTIECVNDELKAGRDVVIDTTGHDGWEPTDLANNNRTVTIQSGTHLWIDGNLDASGEGNNSYAIYIKGNVNATLTVTERLTIRGNRMNDFYGAATVGGLTVNSAAASRDTELMCTMKIVGCDDGGDDLEVTMGTNTLNINEDMTIQRSDGKLATTSGTGSVSVNSHVKIRGSWTLTDPSLVTEYNTLEVIGGSIDGTLILGDGANNDGRYSGTLKTGSELIINNTVAAHQSDAINLQGLPSGVTVTVLQKATISNIPKGVSVIAIDDVVLAGTVSSGDIVWAPGVKVDLADGATVSGDAKDNKLFKDKNGNPISGKVTGELTFENDTGSVIASTQAALDAVIDLVDKLDGNTTAIGEGLADELANAVTGGEGGASGLEDAVAGAVTTPPTADVVTSAGLPFTVMKPTSDEIVEEIGTLSDGAKQEYSIKLNDDSVDIVATKAFDITAGSKLAGIYGGVSDENKADKVIVWKVTGLDYDNGALYRLKFDWASNGEYPVWVKYDKNYGFQKDASTGKGYIIFNTGDKEPTVKLAMVATPTENELTTGNTGSMSGSTIYSVEDKNVIEINIDFDHADATGASS